MMQLSLPFLLLLFSYGHCSIMVLRTEKQAATVGGNVTLLCRLQTAQRNIFQVTWQKEKGNSTETVATCSKLYGERLLGYSASRTAQNTIDTYNETAITINPVTIEDQGCFKCIFNIYPFGANSGRICLDVYESNISEPVLIHQVHSLDTSGKQHVVSCSATGQPAPEISWEMKDDLIIMPQRYFIENSNGTITVISNFTYRPQPEGLETQEVICVVNHPVLHTTIRLTAHLDGTGDKDLPMVIIAFPIVGILLFIIMLVLVVFTVKRKLKSSQKLPCGTFAPSYQRCSCKTRDSQTYARSSEDSLLPPL